MQVKDQQILKAINNLDKNAINNFVDINLFDFMIANINDINPESLIFLHDNYNINLKKIFSLTHPTVEQMDILLRNQYIPSDNMILTYSGYYDLSLYKRLFEHNITIPVFVVWHWDNILYIPALTYYLEHGGNPNIRSFMIKNKKINGWEPSLIDKWIWLQDNPADTIDNQTKITDMVQKLISYGAKKSPYAMTYKEKHAYWELQRNNPNKFIQEQKKKIRILSDSLNKIHDQDEYEEYIWSIRKFEDDINLC